MLPYRTFELRGNILEFRPLTPNEMAEEVADWLGQQLSQAMMLRMSPNVAIQEQAQAAIEQYRSHLTALNEGRTLSFEGAIAQTLFGSPERRIIRKVNIIEPTPPSSP